MPCFMMRWRNDEVADDFAWCQSQPGGLVKRCDSHASQTGWEHGRHEMRRCFVVAATEADWPRARQQWPGLQSLVMLETQRQGIADAGKRVSRELVWSGVFT